MLKIKESKPNLLIEHFRPGNVFYRILLDCSALIIAFVIPLVFIHNPFDFQSLLLTIGFEIFIFILSDFLLGRRFSFIFYVKFDFKSKLCLTITQKSKNRNITKSFPFSNIIITNYPTPNKNPIVLFKIIDYLSHKTIFRASSEITDIKIGSYYQTILLIKKILTENGFILDEFDNPLGQNLPDFSHFKYRDSIITENLYPKLKSVQKLWLINKYLFIISATLLILIFLIILVAT